MIVTQNVKLRGVPLVVRAHLYKQMDTETDLQRAVKEHDDDMARLDRNTLRNTETTPLGQYLLKRQAASLHYVGSSVFEPPIGCEQSAFLAGWDAAVEEIGLILQTPGADGRFCTHHDDDPAHKQDCYSLIEYLTQYSR